MLGSDQPLAFDEAAMREVLARPGVLEDISSAYDSPEHDGRRLDQRGSTACMWISRRRRSTRSPARAR